MICYIFSSEMKYAVKWSKNTNDSVAVESYLTYRLNSFTYFSGIMLIFETLSGLSLVILLLRMGIFFLSY